MCVKISRVGQGSQCSGSHKAACALSSVCFSRTSFLLCLLQGNILSHICFSKHPLTSVPQQNIWHNSLPKETRNFHFRFRCLLFRKLQAFLHPAPSLGGACLERVFMQALLFQHWSGGEQKPTVVFPTLPVYSQGNRCGDRIL